jgi:hypothetical protein
MATSHPLRPPGTAALAAPAPCWDREEPPTPAGPRAPQDVAERGWLLDGYPRSASQAEAIEKEGIRPDVFLLIEVRARRRPPPCGRAAMVAGWDLAPPGARACGGGFVEGGLVRGSGRRLGSSRLPPGANPAACRAPPASAPPRPAPPRPAPPRPAARAPGPPAGAL